MQELVTSSASPSFKTLGMEKKDEKGMMYEGCERICLHQLSSETKSPTPRSEGSQVLLKSMRQLGYGSKFGQKL